MPLQLRLIMGYLGTASYKMAVSGGLGMDHITAQPVGFFNFFKIGNVLWSGGAASSSASTEPIAISGGIHDHVLITFENNAVHT